MLCALTVRKLEPGTFDQFKEAFTSDFDPDAPPSGWVRFDMLRNVDDADEVNTFGFYDGSLEQLRGESGGEERAAQQQRIAPYVQSVGTDGLFEIVMDMSD